MYKNRKLAVMATCLLSMYALQASDFMPHEIETLAQAGNEIGKIVSSTASEVGTALTQASQQESAGWGYLFDAGTSLVSNTFNTLKNRTYTLASNISALGKYVYDSYPFSGVTSSVHYTHLQNNGGLQRIVEKAAVKKVEDTTLDAAHTMAQALVALEKADPVKHVASVIPVTVSAVSTPVIEPMPQTSAIIASKDVALQPVSLKTPEIKTESWGEFLGKWGNRGKYALFAATAIGVSRTIANAYTTYSLTNSYKQSFEEPVFDGLYSPRQFIQYSQYLVKGAGEMPANLERFVLAESRRFKREHIEVLEHTAQSPRLARIQLGISNAISQLEQELYKLRFFANIQTHGSTWTRLATIEWDAFIAQLKIKGITDSLGFLGMAIGGDYYYGHDTVIRLVQNLVLRLAALEIFNTCLIDQGRAQMPIVGTPPNLMGEPAGSAASYATVHVAMSAGTTIRQVPL